MLRTVALLLAPFCPFVADTMWRALSGADETHSVHLADWPDHDPGLIDRDLEAQMGLARRLTSLGRAARSEAGVKVRQPLSRALVFLPPNAPPLLDDMVAEELNVDEIDVADELSEVLQFELSANFRTLGPRLRGDAQHLGPALAVLDGVAAASTPLSLANAGLRCLTCSPNRGPRVLKLGTNSNSRTSPSSSASSMASTFSSSDTMSWRMAGALEGRKTKARARG